MRRLVPLIVLAVLALVPGAASAASRCGTLPVALSLNTDDPTTLIDDASVIASPRGTTISALNVSLRRGSKSVSAGSLPGALTRKGTAVRLTTVGRPGPGTYTIVANGKAKNCARRATARATVKLGKASLPVRAAPLSTIDDGGRTFLRVRLRSVGGQLVTGLRATLRAGDGTTAASVTAPDGFSDSVTLDVPVPGAAGATYTLSLSGRADGAVASSAYAAPIAVPDPTATTGGSSTVTPPPVTAGLTDQHVVVDWSGGDFSGRANAGFDAPGIGYGEIVCRPDAQWIRFFPKNLGEEVAMQNWTYRDWGGGNEKSLREALHTTGTGNDFREGLNKFGPWPEKTSTGQFDGIISDRGLIGTSGGSTAPPTTLHMTWKWDFSQTGKESCHVEADFITETAGATLPLARSAQIVWRGDAASTGRDATTLSLPNGTSVDLTCQATPTGIHRLVVNTALGGTVTDREGSDDADTTWGQGPISAELPNNGQLSLTLADGTTMLVSSRWKVNDPDPTQNFCAIAAQAIERSS